MTVLGVVGLGFVGGAVFEVMKTAYPVETYDLHKECSCKNLEELVQKTQIIFVCLPTPMRGNGSCDLSILQESIFKINSFCMKDSRRIVVIKSTIPPGTTESLNQQCKNIQVIFNPEFLREATFLDDFKNQTRIIIGGPRPGSTVVQNIYRKIFSNVPIIKTGSSTAELVKYFINCFLASKVSFMNEFYQICEKFDVDFDKVTEYALYDERIGGSHLQVPGPDGHFGFGGSCFPKDLNALIFEAKQKGISTTFLDAVWQKNLEMRPEKDWENLKGRAVSSDEQDID